MARVADVSDPSVAKFLSIGGGEVAVRAGVVPKVQTTSAKNAENGVLWARWSAFWAQRAWQGVLLAREPDVASGNPLCRMSTRYLERGRGCLGSY